MPFCAGDQTQGLVCARQVLCHWAALPALGFRGQVSLCSLGYGKHMLLLCWGFVHRCTQQTLVLCWILLGVVLRKTFKGSSQELIPLCWHPSLHASVARCRHLSFAKFPALRVAVVNTVWRVTSADHRSCRIRKVSHARAVSSESCSLKAVKKKSPPTPPPTPFVFCFWSTWAAFYFEIFYFCSFSKTWSVIQISSFFNAIIIKLHF